jgi:PKD repeat protein
MRRIAALLVLLLALGPISTVGQPKLTVGIDTSTRELWSPIIDRFQGETGTEVQLHPYPQNTLAQQIVFQGIVQRGHLHLVMVRNDWQEDVAPYLQDLANYEARLLANQASLVTLNGIPVGISLPFAPDWFLAVIAWPDDPQLAIAFLERAGTPGLSPLPIPALRPETAIESFKTSKISRSSHNSKIDGALEALLGAAQASVQMLKSDAAGTPPVDQNAIANLSLATKMTLNRVATQYGVPFASETAAITVVVEAQSGRARNVVASLSAFGLGKGAIESSTGELVKVTVPLSQLATIATQVGNIAFIRPPYIPHPLDTLSEGVTAIGADALHSEGLTGDGTKVGIIDLGFSGMAQAQARGDLPSAVHQNDLTGTGLGGGITHGTAVAEVVHDVAPGAELHLIKIADEVDLDQAITYCLENGLDIIVHSLGWYNTNFYDGTGTIAEIAKRAIAGGILWVNAAGNEAESHWEGAFIDIDRDSWNDQTLSISASNGESMALYMTWSDWPRASSDYDLYLYDPRGQLLAASTKHQTGLEEPTEAIHTTATSSGTYTVRVKGSGSKKIEIYTLYQPLSPAIAASSILAPANAAEVVAVGAIDYRQYESGPQEPYSSQGPTNDGRSKPDLCAPDNITTGTAPYTRFAGTSSAAPHAAGAAALLLEDNPSLTESQLRQRLLSNAIPMGNSNIYGRGRLFLTPPSPPNWPPSAAFTYTGTLQVGQSILFDASTSSDIDGNIVSYTWQFGDGANGSGRTVQHAYTSSGIYTVILTVKDDDGATDTASKQITIGQPTPPNTPPTASFIYTGTLQVGEPILFDASSSSDPDGRIVSYSWQFGDGANGSGPVVQHPYSSPGSYTARLTVTDNDGGSDATSKQLAIGQPSVEPLSIQLSLPKASYTIGERIAITYSLNREAYVYICDVDASNRVTLIFPSYMEPNNPVQAGTHSLPSSPGRTLQVSGPAGTDTLYAFAAVRPLPNFPTGFGRSFPVLSTDPSSFLNDVHQSMQTLLGPTEWAEDVTSFAITSTAPSTGTLHVSSSPSGATISLDGAVVGNTPRQITVAAGIHTVSFLLSGFQPVTRQVNVEAGRTTTVNIALVPEVSNRPPISAFALDPPSPVASQPVFFDASASYDPDGYIVSFMWDFGDGTGASGPIVTHVYPNTGTYQTRLSVTDNVGTTHATIKTVTVRSVGPSPPWIPSPSGPPMDGIPGIFVWGTDTWHITINAGATWTSAHAYRLELRTDGSFQNVNQSASSGAVPTLTQGGKSLLFEGSLPSGSIDHTFTAARAKSIRMSLKLDIDGDGNLDESPGFIYLRDRMVHPITAPFAVGTPKYGAGPLVPSVNFRLGTTSLIYLGTEPAILWITDIMTLEGR